MTPEQFERQLKKDLRAVKSHVRAGIKRTASKAVRVIKKNTPTAFGELKDSIYATNDSTIVGAPHAQAVEIGSRPHYVPLEELVKWVKLRGMEGLTETGRITRKTKGWSGPTSRDHAMRVAGQLGGMVEDGALAIDAPEQIAKAIQMAIMHHGTKPHWFVQKSMPEIMALLDSEIRKNLTGVDRHYY